jgi:hypothetical protein
MWMCDGCEEINDDNAAVCSRCGKTHSGDVPPPSMAEIRSARESVVPTVLSAVQVGGLSAPNKVPLYFAWAAIVVTSVLPVILLGPTTDRSIFAVIGCACLLGSAYFLWRDVDLLTRGVRTKGTVVSIDAYQQRYTLTYYTNATYTADGVPYSVRSEYGTKFQYYKVGQPINVWYDRGSPGLAVLGGRVSYIPIVIFLVGIAICYSTYTSGIVDALLKQGLGGGS